MSGSTYSARDKRVGENDLQWRSRLARLDAHERDMAEPIVTFEAQQHGDYRDSDVMHVETQTIAVTKRNRLLSPIEDMWGRGGMSDEQFASAIEIASAVEAIERSVSVRGASLEARVDNAGAARDLLIEHIANVRSQITYSRWRERLPMPRRMFIDMIVAQQPLVRTANSYGVPWRKARAMMLKTLNLWTKLRDEVVDEIGRREAEAAQHRAGGGVLLGPREDDDFPDFEGPDSWPA